MPTPNARPLLCLFAGCLLLQGCTTTSPSPIETAALGQITAPVIQKATQKSVQNVMQQNGHTAKPAGKAPVAQKPAQQTSQVKSIKPGTPTSKDTKKLTPEEVEDIIRKLSVCKPH